MLVDTLLIVDLKKLANLNPLACHRTIPCNINESLGGIIEVGLV